MKSFSLIFLSRKTYPSLGGEGSAPILVFAGVARKKMLNIDLFLLLNKMTLRWFDNVFGLAVRVEVILSR